MTTTFTPVQADIHGAYLDLSVKDQDIVRLAQLRPHPKLSGWNRADIDAAIMDLIRSQDVVIVGDSNRKALVQADHDAAIVIGGDPHHLIIFPID